LKADDTGILSAIVRFSLRFRGVIIALATMLILYGIYSLNRVKYDVFPEFASPQVSIRAEAPGFSPEQVEALVTTPIENVINGVQDIESLRSSSAQGLSAITVIFRTGIDIYLARQMITERLSTLAGLLPRGVTPIMTPLTSSTSIVLVLGLESDKRSLMEVRTIADWTLKPRLLAASGVANVAVFGEGIKQLQIQILPDRLVRYNLSLEDVSVVAKKATGIREAGFIDNENQRIVLQTEGQSLTPAQLARVVLAYRDGTGVTLGDVARVVEAPEPPVGAGAIDGRPAILLLVSAQYGANTLEVTKNLDRAINELRPMLQAEGIALHPDLFRPANFIHTAIHNVLSALEIGAVLVVIVLFLFLFNFRTAAISFTAIPLSLITAIIVLDRIGFSLNTLVLSGLAIAIGEVVDDAVIDVENIFRRLRENRHLQNPRPVFRVVFDASIEVRSAVVFATFAVVLVFIPVLTLSGVAGRLFAPLGIAYILAVLSSLIVALTVTPALCLLILGVKDFKEKEPPLVHFLKGKYQNILLRVERHSRWVAGGVAVFLVAGLTALPFLRGEFLPEFREGHYIVHMTLAPGTSLQESLRLGYKASLELLKNPYVRSVAQKAGRAENAAETRGTNGSEFEVDLKTGGSERTGTSQSDIREALDKIPGANFAVNTFLTERIEETISGYTAPVAINVFGDKLDILEQKGEEIARVLKEVRGAEDILVQSVPGIPQVTVDLIKEDLLRWGFDPVGVLDSVRMAYQGSVVGQIYDRGRVFDVSVILDPAERNTVSGIGKLPLHNSVGQYIPLREIASIREESGRSVILHDGGRRVQTITCNVSGRNISSFTADTKRRIMSAIALPRGTYIDFAGTGEAQARSKRDLLFHSLTAVAGIVLLLFFVLRSHQNVLLIFLNLPFALVGSVLAALLTGGTLSLGSMVGFVTVFGITLRNSIMMISHYDHLVSVEGMTWGPETALRGASERLAPILMTAMVTSLGLLPLAIGSGAPGREIEGPMALVILGGLITSTALNLLVLPTLALRYASFKKKEWEL